MIHCSSSCRHNSNARRALQQHDATQSARASATVVGCAADSGTATGSFAPHHRVSARVSTAVSVTCRADCHLVGCAARRTRWVVCPPIPCDGVIARKDCAVAVTLPYRAGGAPQPARSCSKVVGLHVTRCSGDPAGRSWQQGSSAAGFVMLAASVDHLAHGVTHIRVRCCAGTICQQGTAAKVRQDIPARRPERAPDLDRRRLRTCRSSSSSSSSPFRRRSSLSSARISCSNRLRRRSAADCGDGPCRRSPRRPGEVRTDPDRPGNARVVRS